MSKRGKAAIFIASIPMAGILIYQFAVNGVGSQDDGRAIFAGAFLFWGLFVMLAYSILPQRDEPHQ
jgi:hypothetical protein